jgi:hypothetical protein
MLLNPLAIVIRLIAILGIYLMWQEKLLAMLGVGIMGIEGKWCGRPRYFLKFSSIFLGDRRIRKGICMEI